MALPRTATLAEAITRLSHLVDMVESGEVDEVIIARDGKAVARLVPVLARPAVRLGVARGRIAVPASIDHSNEELRDLFEDNAGAPARTRPPS